MATITLGGKETHTSGNLPSNGTNLSDVTLTGIDMQDFDLKKFEGKKVVLNIFPSVDTGVCATSVRKFNEKAAGLSNTAVVNVSKDLPFAQKRFCGAEGIENVEMGSDFRHGSFTKHVNVGVIDGAFKGLMSRAIIVLDENGNVIYTEQVPEIGQEPNYDGALSAVKG